MTVKNIRISYLECPDARSYKKTYHIFVSYKTGSGCDKMETSSILSDRRT